MFTRHDPREAVLLLGDGKGGFSRATIEGIPLRPQSNYDLLVADVNGDSRPDVIVMYEAESATSLSARNGSVHVYLNMVSTRVRSLRSGRTRDRVAVASDREYSSPNLDP
jgi:hypothetical protein